MTQADGHGVADRLTVTVGEDVSAPTAAEPREGAPADVDTSGYVDAAVKGPGPEWPERPPPQQPGAALPQPDVHGDVKGPDPAVWG